MLLQDLNSCGINLHLCRLESECEREQIMICVDDRRETDIDVIHITQALKVQMTHFNWLYFIHKLYIKDGRGHHAITH